MKGKLGLATILFGFFINGCGVLGSDPDYNAISKSLKSTRPAIPGSELPRDDAKEYTIRVPGPKGVDSVYFMDSQNRTNKIAGMSGDDLVFSIEYSYRDNVVIGETIKHSASSPLGKKDINRTYSYNSQGNIFAIEEKNNLTHKVMNWKIFYDDNNRPTRDVSYQNGVMIDEYLYRYIDNDAVRIYNNGAKPEVEKATPIKWDGDNWVPID